MTAPLMTDKYKWARALLPLDLSGERWRVLFSVKEIHRGDVALVNVSAIAAMTGLNRRTVNRHLQASEAEGLIAVEWSKGGRAPHRIRLLQPTATPALLRHPECRSRNEPSEGFYCDTLAVAATATAYAYARIFTLDFPGGPALQAEPDAGAESVTGSSDVDERPAPDAGLEPAGASIDVVDDGMPDCPRRPPPTEEEADAEWLRRHREGLEEERREAERAAHFEARVEEDDEDQDEGDEFDRLGIPPAAADRARAMWSMLNGGERRNDYESKIATAMRTDPQAEAFLRRQLAIVAALVGLTHPRFVGQQIAESLERGIRRKLSEAAPAPALQAKPLSIRTTFRPADDRSAAHG